MVVEKILAHADYLAEETQATRGLKNVAHPSLCAWQELKEAKRHVVHPIGTLRIVVYNSYFPTGTTPGLLGENLTMRYI
jgi:hypothetical protein